MLEFCVLSFDSLRVDLLDIAFAAFYYLNYGQL